VEVFRDEVRLTYLHELGHYLGWDEDELAARGLD
jgi:predicted Zn-dependent protease with MMP-like domain